MSETQKKTSFRKLSPQKVDEIISDFYEVELKQSFSILRETLSRIGKIKNDELWQFCHILHKKEKYYIVHFKQLFALDGKPFNYRDIDKETLKKTLILLKKWDLVELVDPDKNKELDETNETIFVDVVSSTDAGSYKKKKYYSI